MRDASGGAVGERRAPSPAPQVLAYTLDHGGFTSVPPTIQAEAFHPAFHVQSMRPLSRYGAKVGSLQAWVSHAELAADLGYAGFPADEVHKLAILDLRLLNTDRNDGNILVTRRTPWSTPAPRVSGGQPELDNSKLGLDGGCGEGGGGASLKESEESPSSPQSSPSLATAATVLVPIDHGGALPSRPEVVWYNWCWISWPQIKAPLSARAKEYVRRLDPIADARAIVDAGLSPACARVCRCSTHVLQAGTAANLTLYEIATFVAREDEEIPSEFERLWGQAERLAYSAMRNHRLRGSAPHESARLGGAVNEKPQPTSGGEPLMRRTMSYGSVADVASPDEPESVVVSPRSPPRDSSDSSGPSSSPVACPARRASERDESAPAADADADGAGPANGARRFDLRAEAVSSGAEMASSGAEMMSSSPPETVASLPPPMSPASVRRSLGGGLHRRVASSSMLVGLDSMSEGALDGFSGGGGLGGLGGPLGGRTPGCAGSQPEYDEEMALEMLFHTYFERLVDDVVKRLSNRKVQRERQEAARQEAERQQRGHGQGKEPLEEAERMHTGSASDASSSDGGSATTVDAPLAEESVDGGAYGGAYGEADAVSMAPPLVDREGGASPSRRHRSDGGAHGDSTPRCECEHGSTKRWRRRSPDSHERDEHKATEGPAAAEREGGERHAAEPHPPEPSKRYDACQMGLNLSGISVAS